MLMLLPFFRIVDRGAVLDGSVLVYDVREISDQIAESSIIINCMAAGVSEINILLRMLIRLDNGKSSFFKLFDIILIVPFDVMQVFELKPHQIIGLYLVKPTFSDAFDLAQVGFQAIIINVACFRFGFLIALIKDVFHEKLHFCTVH